MGTAEGISLYIHIPYCLSKCAYCDFFSKPLGRQKDLLRSDEKFVPDSYLEALCNEIAYRISYYKIKKLNTIYIGGGTPSLLTTAQFQFLFSTIRACAKLSPEAEITVEVNPDDVSNKLVEGLEACGVNRISCGIQSLKDEVLKKACRRADCANNLRAMTIFRNKWKGEVSVDLISGLPGETEESFLKGLELICDEKPSHVSLYSLTIEENTPFGRQLALGKMKYDYDAADRMWLLGRNFLEAHGYKWYEVSNFCLPEKECVHNLAYWTHKSYLGCGSGACGTVYSEDGTGFRWTNTSDIEEYSGRWLNSRKTTGTAAQPAEIPEIIDLQTSKFEFFMMGLRKISGVSEKEYRKLFGMPFPESFVQLFKNWEAKGLCEISEEGRWSMSREGMLFLNRFLEELC